MLKAWSLAVELGRGGSARKWSPLGKKLSYPQDILEGHIGTLGPLLSQFLSYYKIIPHFHHDALPHRLKERNPSKQPWAEPSEIKSQDKHFPLETDIS